GSHNCKKKTATSLSQQVPVGRRECDVMRLKDRVCIVTGGGQGIGEAICKTLAAEGGVVVVADVRQETAKAVAEAIRQNGGHAMAVKVDVTVREEVERMVEETKRAYGR